MPELHAIHGRVDINSESVDRAAIKLKLLSDEAKLSTDKAGTALLTFGEKGEIAAVKVNSATAKSREDLDRLAERARIFASSLEGDFAKGSTAVLKLQADGEVALRRVGETIGNTGAAASKAALDFAALGQIWSVALGTMVVGAVATAIALSPVIVELGAFTVGLTAATSVMALGLGGFAALGAGILLLGNRTQEGQQALAGLTAHVGQLADALGKQAAPLMGPIITLLSGIADQVAHLGSQILEWLGARMGTVLQTATMFLNDILGNLADLGPVVGRFLDAFIARAPALAGLFDMMLAVGVKAVDGLLTNFLKLTNWFMARLPQMGAIAAGIMDRIGDALQNIAKFAGQVVDWFSVHWREIGDVAGQTFVAIAQGWSVVQAQLRTIQPHLGLVGDLFRYVRDHADQLKFYLQALGVVLGVVAVLVVGVVVALAELAAAAEALVQVVGFSRDRIGDAFSAIGSVANWLRNAVGGAFSSIGSTIRSVVDGIVGDLRRASDAIGGLLLSLSRLPGAGALSNLGASLAGQGADLGGKFQSGGYAPPGRVFTVGETGQERGMTLPGGGA
jgi:hypothetical protein